MNKPEKPRTVSEFRELTLSLGLFTVTFENGQIESFKVEEHIFDPEDFQDGRLGLVLKLDQCAADLDKLRARVCELLIVEAS